MNAPVTVAVAPSKDAQQSAEKEKSPEKDDGNEEADMTADEAIAADVAALPVSCPRPSLAVVHVAHRADSALYVERKREACARVGIDDWSVDLPPAISQVRPDALCLQP